jgi:hypothetical protein
LPEPDSPTTPKRVSLAQLEVDVLHGLELALAEMPSRSQKLLASERTSSTTGASGSLAWPGARRRDAFDVVVDHRQTRAGWPRLGRHASSALV